MSRSTAALLFVTSQCIALRLLHLPLHLRSLSLFLSLTVCTVSACLLLSFAVPLLFTGNTFIWRGIEALDEASSSEKRRTQSTSHQQQAARQTPQTAPASASEASAQTAAARPSSHRANRPSLSVCGRPPKWCSPLTSFHLSLSLPPTTT